MNALITIIFLFLCWVMYELIHKKYIIENSRNNLFALRHRLFMLAANNDKLKFDSKLYREMELAINSNIRYLHKINYLTLVFHKIFTNNHKFKENKTIDELLNNAEANAKYDQEIIQELKKIKTRLDTEILKYLVKSSFTLCLVFLGIAVYIVFDFIGYLIKNKVKEFTWKSEYKEKFLNALMQDNMSNKLISEVEKIAQKDIKWA